MYEYLLIYRCADGFEGIETVMAVNRIMAMEIFKDFNIEDVVFLDCRRIKDEEEEEYE